MKFIRNWLKNIIKESVRENFPPIDISVTKENDSQYIINITNGIFNDSRITVTNKEKINLDGCMINQPKDKSFINLGNE